MVRNRDYDVIIVGSGLAGLSAARQLILAGQRVVVLEASNRPGGRIAFDRIADQQIEIGASFISPDDEKVLELLRSNEILAKSAAEGIFTLQTSLQYQIKKKNFWTRYVLKRALLRLRRSLNELNASEPWMHPAAGVLDKITFDNFLRKLAFANDSRQLLHDYFEGELGYDITCISALDALHCLKCRDWEPDHSHLSKRLIPPVGGLYRLFTKLGFEFDIKYQHPVHEVEQFKNRVVVSGAFFKYKGRHLILAVPIPALRSIKFSPQMPKSRRSLWDHVFSAQVFRVTSVFQGQPKITMEKSIAPFHSIEQLQLANDQFIISGEARGKNATKLSQMASNDLELEWAKIIRSIFSLSVGPISSTSKFWNDDFWHCGIRLFRPLGSWTSQKDLMAHPQGRIHFAGSETSVAHYGSMEGAVRSGLRAAEEILSKSPAYHVAESD